MKTKSIMKRSTFTRRRKIIIYIIASMLILGIVAGFTDPFITDGTIHSAQFGQTIVMESEPPQSGDPSQYDLISNLKFAAYKIHHAQFFRGETNGTAVADLGITTYTQYIHNTRVSNGGGVVFAETISSSSLKSVAEQKYADNGIIVFRPSTSINGTSATFANTAYQMTYEDYANKYGTIPDQLSKYVIDETTIIGVKDENAKSQPAANAALTSSDEENASGAVGFDFYVPQNLVPGEDGNYTFTLTLDPEKSSIYYRNEVRTLAGADQNPKFYSASVTITIAPDWTPISVYTKENYDVAIPVLGAMNCTGTLTEVFTEIGSADGVIPETEFFQPYVDAAKNDPDYVPPAPPPAQLSPADYLATAFADYLSGERDLDLTVDLDIAGISAYDLTLSLNLGTMDVQALLGDLYVKYSGDKVNIRLNDINGYLSVSDFNSLLGDNAISSLLAGMGDLSNFDITSLFGGDMLGTVFNACEMTSEDGITRIRLPFALDLSSLGIGADSATVDASLYIADEDMALQSIAGEVTLLGKTITIEAQPLTRLPSFPSTEGATDLSALLDFVPDIVTLAESKTFGINGTIEALGQSLEIDAYIDITDGIKADAMISVLGADVSVKYVDGLIYLGLGNIDARGTAEELMSLASPLLGSSDISKYLNIIKMMMPSTVNDFIGTVKSLDVTPEKLTLGLNLLTAPISISLERANDAISGLQFAFDFDMFGIKLDAAADLDITTPQARDIVLPDGDEYISFEQLGVVIEQLKPYIDAQAFDISANGSISATNAYGVSANVTLDLGDDQTGMAASGSVTALGQTADITYADGIAYFALGNLKFKLDTQNTDALMQSVMRLLGVDDMPTVDTNAVVPQALDAVKSLTVADDGKITAVIQASGADITAVIDLSTGAITVTGTVSGATVSLDVTITPSTEHATISAPADAQAYIDCARLAPALDTLAQIKETKSISANIALEIAGRTERALIEASIEDVKLRLTLPAYGLNLTVIGEKAYIAVGDIRVVGSLDDIPALIDAIDPVLPNDVKQAMTDVAAKLENLPELQILIGRALDAITSLTFDEATDTLNATVTYADVAAFVEISADLGSIAANIVIDNNNIEFSLDGITSTAVTIATPTESYAELCDIITIANSIIPLALDRSFEIELRGELLGTSLRGSLYLDFTDGISAEANFKISDVSVQAAVTDNMLYLTVGQSLKISEELSASSLSALANELESYIPGISARLNKLLSLTKNISIPALLQTALNDVSLCAYGNNGITIGITESGKVALNIILDTNGTSLTRISANGNILGKSVNATFDVSAANGVISELSCENANIAGIATTLDIGITSIAHHAVAPIPDCIPAINILSSVSQIAEVAISATNGNGVKLNFASSPIAVGTSTVTVGGNAEISVSPLAASATVTAMLGNGDAYTVDVIYTDGIAYAKLNGIKIKIDTAKDIAPLYELASPFLPQDIDDMIAVMLGVKEGTTPLDGLLNIFNRIKGLITDPTAQNIASVLLGRNGDEASLAKTLLDMIELNALGNTFTLGVSTADMGLNITPFADSAIVKVKTTALTASVKLSGIASETVTIPAPDGDHTSLGTIIAAARSVTPFVGEKALQLGIDGALFDTPIVGSAYIDLSNGLSAEIKLSIADLPVEIVVLGDMLYMSVNGNIRVSERITEQAIINLVTELDVVMPGIKDAVQSIIDGIKSMTVYKLLGLVEVNAQTDGAVDIALDLTDNGMNITAALGIRTDKNGLSAIGIDCMLFGTNFALDLDAVTDEQGKLLSLGNDALDIMGAKLALEIAVEGTPVHQTSIKPISGCIELSELTAFIKPALALVSEVQQGVDTISVDLGAFVLTTDNEQVDVSGSALIELGEQIKVLVALSLFDGTDNNTELTVTYANGTVYVACGTILVSLDTANDLYTLYDILKNYLPEYINYEIAKLLGLADGASALSDLSLVMERLGNIANAESAEEVIGLLFTKLDGLSDDSAAKTLLSMISLNGGDEISVDLEVIGFVLNITPHLANGKIAGATIKTSLSGLILQVDVKDYALGNSLEQSGENADAIDTISAPDNADEYLSVIEFAELINSAVNTFTTVDENGDITFAVNDFNFDYTIYKVETTVDVNGNTVNVKENGRDKPLIENGQKVVDKTIKVTTKQGADAALKGMFKRVEQENENGEIETSYRFNLEAHIKLDISSLTYSTPLTLDLYVINETGNGIALLDYMEGNGNGERISIDYESIMQMVAAIMDIIGVDEDVTEMLVGDYRQDIDTSIFEYMDIVGVDSIRTSINAVADALQTALSAADDIKAAWDLFYYAGSIDGLKARLDDTVTADGEVVSVGITTYITDAMSKLKTAAEMLGDDDETADTENGSDLPQDPQSSWTDGKVFHDIVYGVKLNKNVIVSDTTERTEISADVSNELATGTSGTANVTVTKADNAIDRIEVDNLDVNTAKLHTFDMRFTAGKPVTVKLPDNYETSVSSGMTYNNFANIKHLIFDVMNTANMLEFEIGDLNSDTTDYINLNVLSVINVNIKYSAKVRIIEQPDGVEPRFKTAADITLDIPGFHTNAGKLTVFGLAKCVTRIFFYDNVLYIHGVDNWKGNAPWVGSNYTYDVTYGDYAFTVEELGAMLSSDDGMERLFKDVIFKLLPLRETFVVNIHDQIINAVKNPPAAEDKLHTIAQIFKGYSYDESTGEHAMTIGLKELALNGSLRDVFIKFTGANDGDDNVLDNYISTAYIETNFAGVADLKLHASLTNANRYEQYYTDEAMTEISPNNEPTDYQRYELASKGLSNTVIDNVAYTFTGDNDTNSIIDRLLAEVTTDENGKITTVTNRPNGVQWSRPWQSA